MAIRASRTVAVVSTLLVVLAACTSTGEMAPARSRPPDPASATVRFTDVAAERGLTFTHGAFRFDPPGDPVAMMSGGLCWLDYDDDGWLDLFVVNSYAIAEVARLRDAGGLPTSALYRNVEGDFADVTDEAGAGIAAQGMGCVAADLDDDGHTDLYVTTGDENHLLWNEGDGTFTSGGRDAGVQGFAWHAGAAGGDLNGDGLVDLFVAGYVDLNNPVGDATLGFPNSFLGQRDLLYLNEGSDGGRPTFREVGRIVGLEHNVFDYGLGALLDDFDRDGDLDLYVVNETNPNRLYENVPWPGGPAADPEGIGFRFAEIAAPSGVADPGGGMGVTAGDIDATGTADLVVTNFNRDPHAAFAGVGGLAFTNATASIGIPGLGIGRTGWGVALFDIDLDTDLDLLIANGFLPVSDLVADAQPFQALRNLTADGTTGRFEDVSGVLGLDAIGPRNARGLAVADYDQDGDLDVAVNILAGSLMLLENRGADGYWLIVAPEDPEPGTSVTVRLADGRELVRSIVSGSSYLSTDALQAGFGLGTTDGIEKLTVRWPDGATAELEDVDADRIIIVSRP